jgi:pimeloyl-ACP methyl ester carboxylesterase
VAFVSARGLAFHVEELGPGTSRSPSLDGRHAPLVGEEGPPAAAPVVMLHGLLLGNLASWYFTSAPALAAVRRVVLYDLRGHGRSERPETGYGVASMAEDLAELASVVAPGPLCLVGHSYGGLVALRFAIDHPDRVEQLAIVDAPVPPGGFAAFREFVELDPEAMVAALPEPIAALTPPGSLRAKKLEGTLRALTEGTSLLADLRSEPDVSDAELAGVRCPVLCIYGSRSSCLPSGRRLAAALPRGRLLVLEGGHDLPLEATRPLTDALMAMLAIPAGAARPAAQRSGRPRPGDAL